MVTMVIEKSGEINNHLSAVARNPHSFVFFFPQKKKKSKDSKKHENLNDGREE